MILLQRKNLLNDYLKIYLVESKGDLKMNDLENSQLLVNYKFTKNCFLVKLIWLKK